MVIETVEPQVCGDPIGTDGDAAQGLAQSRILALPGPGRK